MSLQLLALLRLESDGQQRTVAAGVVYDSSHLEQSRLVRRRVATQHGIVVDVVGVVGTSRHVVFGDEQFVEVLLDAHDGRHVVEERERLPVGGNFRFEVLLDSRAQYTERVFASVVQVHAHFIENIIRHVISRVRLDDV